MNTPRCIHCDNPAVLSWDEFGRVWVCTPCKAWSGIHVNSKSNRPLGSVCNAELHEIHRQTQTAFHGLWSKGSTTRDQAVIWMIKVLEIDVWRASIAKLSAKECAKLVQMMPIFPKTK